MQVAFENTQTSEGLIIKVEHQGYISQKMAVLGALVFHKHILFSIKVSFGLTLQSPSPELRKTRTHISV